MKKFQKFSELFEFGTDGSVYQLASGKQWNEAWSKIVRINGLGTVKIFGGWTSTMKDVHTAVVSVKVIPRGGVGEDLGTESILLYSKDWRSPEDAKNDVLRYKNSIKLI